MRPAADGAVAILSVDVTSRVLMEERTRHTYKMEAVGRLAGGVAHDFSNILTSVLTFAGFARDALPAEHPSRADLDEVLRAAERASSLVAQLLAFTRRMPVAPRLVTLNSVVMGMEPLLRRGVGSHVQWTVKLAEDAWQVRADPSGLEQVLVNLVANARDAMPQGGAITLRTLNVTLEQATPEGLEPGDYAVLVLEDTGAGIPEPTRQRLFDPYFTTKNGGSGAGLGLSASYGIVTQAQGNIRVLSTPGQGSTFQVYLPRAATQDATAALPGPGHVLVVEDDPGVRKVVVRILKHAGYVVAEAAGASEALALVRAATQAVDVLLTDVAIPDANGVALAQTIRRELEEVRVVFMTGATPETLGLTAAQPWCHILRKPFTPDQLLETMQRAVRPGA